MGVLFGSDKHIEGENWLSLVNNCIYYADQTYEIYQVLLYSVDLRAPGEPWNPLRDWWIPLPKGQ